ncbi:prenyltransferase/squalene oxidase repeat-containing protein [Candidatus Harpocratesius sp.]
MKRRHQLTILISITFMFSLILSAQYAVATSRKELLEQFCLSNQHSSGAFLDSPSGNGDNEATLSEFTTYANLFILSQIDPELNNLNDQGIIRSYLRDRYLQFSDVGVGIISQVYYAYFAGLLVDTNFTTTLIEDATTKLFDLQNATNSGFASKDAKMPTLSNTFFAVKLLTSFGKINETSPTDIAEFVLSTWNSEELAFASAPGAEASLIDTYYAVAILNELNLLNQLNSSQIDGMTTYIESFYFGDQSTGKHFGGYGIKSGIMQSSLMLTYYAVNTLSILNQPLHDETFNWVLSRQNPVDYGFADVNVDSSDAISSAKLSYYAVKVILTFDSDAFSSSRNAVMNEEIWQLSTNPWAIVGIVAGCVIAVSLIIFGIWKYKNRI